jgi:histidyl-tRNA synthetase
MAGSPNPSADAEVISHAKQIIDNIGVKNVELRINSIGCPECRKKYQEALKAYFQPHYDTLCPDCKSRLERNPMRLLDCKNEKCHQIGKGAPEILDYLCDDCSQHFEKLKRNLGLRGIVYTIDPRNVRGLDYYTKTVFEFVTTHYNEKEKKQETLTVCGGGRYDGLIEQLGGQPTPALGFGMGLERMLMTLHQQGVTLAEPSKCDIYFVPMGEKAEETALQLTASLRKDGIFALTDVVGRGLRAQMKYADKIGARFTMVIGDNELESGEAVLKNMQTGEKITMKLDETLPERFADIEIADRLAKE